MTDDLPRVITIGRLRYPRHYDGWPEWHTGWPGWILRHSDGSWQYGWRGPWRDTPGRAVADGLREELNRVTAEYEETRARLECLMADAEKS